VLSPDQLKWRGTITRKGPLKSIKFCDICPIYYIEKWRHFVSSKALLCFRVRVIELGLGLAEIRFRSNVFSSKCSRTKFCWFVSLFVASLSFCHEKATVALYFGRIRTRLGVVHFRVFRLFLWLVLTTKFAAWEIIIVKRLIQGRNKVCDEGESWT